MLSLPIHWARGQNLSKSVDQTTGQFQNTLDNKSDSLEGYYNKHYLLIGGYLALQSKLLSQINPKKPGKAGKQALAILLQAEAKIKKAMLGLETVSKQFKYRGNKFGSQFQIISNVELKGMHHELMVYFEQFGKELNQPRTKPLKNFLFNYQKQIQRELSQRNVFPKSFAKAKFPLLQQRHELIKKLNQLAIQEAQNLIDGSPLTISTREKMGITSTQINKLDQQLGITVENADMRQNLTLNSVERRIEILQEGYKEVQKKHHIKRHLDLETGSQLKIIDENLANEKNYIFKIQKHEILKNAINIRGPSQDPPKCLTCLPKPPNDKPLTPLDPGLTQKARELGDQKLKNTLNKQYALFKAYLSESFIQDGVKSEILPKDIFSKNTNVGNYMRHKAKTYFEVINNDVKQAFLAKASFDFDRKAIGINKKLVPAQFLSNAEKQLIANNLTNIKKALEKQKASQGITAPKWIDKAIILINKELDNLKIPPPIDLPSLPQEILTRPPPPPNELGELARLEHQKRALQKSKAILGVDVPPSMINKYQEIKKVIKTHQSMNLLASADQYANNQALMKFIEFLPKKRLEENKQLKALVSKVNTQKKKLAQKVGETLRKSAKDLPQAVVKNLKGLQRTLPRLKQPIKVDELIPIPSQDFKKLTTMTKAKTPGGIWLTPEVLLKVKNNKLYEESWTEHKANYACKGHHEEWLLDEHTKICFTSKLKYNAQTYWISQLKPWN